MILVEFRVMRDINSGLWTVVKVTYSGFNDTTRYEIAEAWAQQSDANMRAGILANFL